MDIYLCFIIGEGTKRVIDFRVGGVHLVLIAVAPNFIICVYIYMCISFIHIIIYSKIIIFI